MVLMCSFSWSHRYKTYWVSLYPQNAKIGENSREPFKIRFVNHWSIDSDRAVVSPIWVGGGILPAMVRLISGRAELLLGMGITEY